MDSRWGVEQIYDRQINDEWVDQQREGWVGGGWVVRWMVGVDGWMVNRWMDGQSMVRVQMGKQVGGWISEWMEEWVRERKEVGCWSLNFFIFVEIMFIGIFSVCRFRGLLSCIYIKIYKYIYVIYLKGYIFLQFLFLYFIEKC